MVLCGLPQQVRTTAAIHTMSAPDVFGGKKFKDIKLDAQALIDAEDKNITTIKQLMVSQGFLAE